MDIQARSSYIRRKDMDSVLNCMVSDRLSGGDYPDRFVKAARERFGFDYGLALRSPLVAMDLVYDCLGLEAGDGVALSALSEAWLVRGLLRRGLKPVWLDVDPATACISADSVARIAEGSAKALYLDSPWGIMPDPSILAEIGIPVIEDATTSIGATAVPSATTDSGTLPSASVSDSMGVGAGVGAVAGELKAGSLGAFCLIGLEHASSFTGGGGALLFAQARRDAQVLRNVAERLTAVELMPDMNAALALSQLKDLEKFLEKRRGLSEMYGQSLARAHKKALAQSVEGTSACFGCVVVLESGVKDVRAYAKKKDVDTVMAFDGSCVAAGLVPDGLAPQAVSLANRALAFPLHPRIGKTAAQKIAKVLATLP
ncbi:MAG: DegT/DnrJ/EryC1/StrS family aminotransferase [Spirochaetia bacterium]|nr:DegT/DnrJ/EryC1/StrS family aminotransferase [Spirochaetia bacterium]